MYQTQRTEMKIEMIKQRRTNKQLSEMTGIHKSTISSILSGRIIPSEKEALSIAVALNRKPEELFS